MAKKWGREEEMSGRAYGAKNRHRRHPLKTKNSPRGERVAFTKPRYGNGKGKEEEGSPPKTGEKKIRRHRSESLEKGTSTCKKTDTKEEENTLAKLGNDISGEKKGTKSIISIWGEKQEKSTGPGLREGTER